MSSSSLIEESCASSAAEDDWAELLTLMEENELEESTSREKKAGTNAVRWSWLHALVMSVALLGLCILMGVVMGNMRSSGRGRAEARLALWPEPLWSNPCAGSIQVSGLGTVPLINAKYNLPSDPAGNVWMEDAAVVIADKGRTYWGTSCDTSGHQKNFHPSGYIELHLLGKRLEYTTDINGVQCGCNAALYLVSMSRSPWQSTCEDYYCDAMSICGVQCHEIDLQEANMRAFHSTFHDLESVSAPSLGTGGGGDTFTGPRDFGSTQYGEGSSCIDTREKFRVSVEFPVHEGTEELKSIDITLSQNGCSVRSSASKFKDSLEVLSKVLKKGMTPVMSYWRDANMMWLDGNGPDEVDYCTEDMDANSTCASTVTFTDFALSTLEPRIEIDQPLPILATFSS